MSDLVKPLQLILMSDVVLLPGKKGFPTELAINSNFYGRHIISPAFSGELNIHNSLDYHWLENGQTLYASNYNLTDSAGSVFFDLKDYSGKIVAKFGVCEKVNRSLNKRLNVELVTFYSYFKQLSETYTFQGLKIPDYLEVHRKSFELFRFVVK